MPFRDKDGSDKFVPFHIFTVKNASLNTENNISHLRINFHVPGSGAKEIQFPSKPEPNTLFIKEITVKSTNVF